MSRDDGQAFGSPCDTDSRPTNIAMSTLTVRNDRDSGEATFILPWRDPAKLGHAGGLFQVAGIFQASGEPRRRHTYLCDRPADGDSR